MDRKFSEEEAAGSLKQGEDTTDMCEQDRLTWPTTTVHGTLQHIFKNSREC